MEMFDVKVLSFLADFVGILDGLDVLTCLAFDLT